MKELLKRLLHDTPFLSEVFYELRSIGGIGWKDYWKGRRELWRLSFALPRALKRYKRISYRDLVSKKKSDTVFILGSGYSLNNITPQEWERIAQHDTFGFSGSVYQQWVRMDFHLIRGWVESPVGTAKWRTEAGEYAQLLANNPCFKKTTLVLQNGFSAVFTRGLLTEGMLPNGSEFIFYRTGSRRWRLPFGSFSRGAVHVLGTLTDVVNIAYTMGWKRIVLLGVDLYDNRYFWLKENETLSINGQGQLVVSDKTARGLFVSDKHQTARNGIVDLMGEWCDFFHRHGVSLTVYNPRSLLTRTVPVFSWDHLKSEGRL